MERRMKIQVKQIKINYFYVLKRRNCKDNQRLNIIKILGFDENKKYKRENNLENIFSSTNNIFDKVKDKDFFKNCTNNKLQNITKDKRSYG